MNQRWLFHPSEWKWYLSGYLNPELRHPRVSSFPSTFSMFYPTSLEKPTFLKPLNTSLCPCAAHYPQSRAPLVHQGHHVPGSLAATLPCSSNFARHVSLHALALQSPPQTSSYLHDKALSSACVTSDATFPRNPFPTSFIPHSPNDVTAFLPLFPTVVMNNMFITSSLNSEQTD